jgi:hypothetical protein
MNVTISDNNITLNLQSLALQFTPVHLLYPLGFLLILWWFWPQADQTLERFATDLHSGTFEYEDEDDDLQVQTPQMPRIVRLTVAHLRSELGCLSDNAANRKVVSHAARKFMADRGMRPTHISRFFNYAILAYFMDSKDDRLCAEVASTKYYRLWKRNQHTSQ